MNNYTRRTSKNTCHTRDAVTIGLKSGCKGLTLSSRTIALLSFVCLFVSILLFKFVDVNANKNPELSMKKQYVSIQIQQGDSLWSIADEYMGPGYDNINDYIKEIKKINGLKSQTIHVGGYIVIPQYITVK